jgi:ribosomal-protein-alanine N-acetyltransferase
MESLTIRQCYIGDLKSVYQLERNIFGLEGYSYLALRQFYDVCGRLFRVAAISNSTIVGYTIGCPKVYTSDAWILALAVSPHYQQQGIGKKLSYGILKEFTKLEIKRAFLTVRSDNQSAINLYNSIGFSFIAHEKDYFGEDSPRNIMQKKL